MFSVVNQTRGRHGRDCMVVGFKLQVPVQSVPITTNVRSNPTLTSVHDTTLCDKVCQ
jgi:hypothetical protein